MGRGQDGQRPLHGGITYNTTMYMIFQSMPAGKAPVNRKI